MHFIITAPGEIREPSFKSQIKIFGTAETKRNREFRPDNKARSLLISLSAQFKVLAKEIPDILAGYPIPIDIRRYISLDDRSGKGVFCVRALFQA
jgi:hypothetical protein